VNTTYLSTTDSAYITPADTADPPLSAVGRRQDGRRVQEKAIQKIAVDSEGRSNPQHSSGRPGRAGDPPLALGRRFW
jgi:hypothetical protein